MPDHKLLYTNPKNLNFYLAKGKISQLKSQIIEKKSIKTELGEVEIAIIGASHYFQFNNCVYEILTCLAENIEKEQIIFNKKNIVSLKESYELANFFYQIIIQKEKFENEEVFLQKEQNILQKKHSLVHCFSDKSAITALNLQHNSEEINLKTIHSYPDFNTIVYSHSRIIDKL